MDERSNHQLSILVENQMITTQEKNLRNKIDSIVRSLENLSAKKLRLEFEIKRQKKSLTRKREELKRVSKLNQAKVKLTLESGNLEQAKIETVLNDLRRIDAKLLQGSDQVLNQ